MKISFRQCLCFIVFCIKLTEAQDPCNMNNFRPPREKYRGTLCEYRVWKDATNDRILKPGWYNVQGVNGFLTMPIKPVQPFQCSARFPIWMNGTHPSESDGVVNRTCCVVSQSSNCEYEIQIQVRNCSSFTAYYLPSTLGADEGYCFGEGEACPPEDPCEEYDRRDLPVSSTTCAADDGTFMCNQSLPNSWYKLHIEGNQKMEIPISCPEQANCGTAVQFWMNGSVPTSSAGMVSRELCMSFNNSCCRESFNIEVKNCNDFIAYKLQNFMCPLQFCLDNKQICDLDSSTADSRTTLQNGSYNSSSGIILNTIHKIAIFVAGILLTISFL